MVGYLAFVEEKEGKREGIEFVGLRSPEFSVDGGGVWLCVLCWLCPSEDKHHPQLGHHQLQIPPLRFGYWCSGLLVSTD